MRSKVTIVLLFLNVVLFYYIFHYEDQWRAERANLEARRRVLGSEIATLDSLTRLTRTGPTIKLERRGESWSLTQPYEWPADANAMARVINELQFLEHETSFPVADLAKSGQSLADFGLSEPAITLGFTSAGQEYTLKIGDNTKIGSRLYVLSPDGTQIHVVNRSLAESVGLPLETLRAKSVFTVPVFEVRSLNVVTSAPSNLKVRLRRDANAHWGFEAPIIARASKAAVEVTINALNALNAKNFLAFTDTDLTRTGLNAPALRVTLEGNARRETLLIGQATADVAGTPAPAAPPAPSDGKETPVDYFAKFEDKAVVFTVAVPPGLLADLRGAQDKLRDARVVDFEPRTVTALTLTAPGQPELNLQRLDGNPAATWQLVMRVSGQAPQISPADHALIEELIQKIHLLSATKFLSDAPSAAQLETYGFNRPEREITLSLSTGGGPKGTEPTTVNLQIGVAQGETGIAYARTSQAPFVYQIVPDLLDETPVRALHYRQRLVRELPEGTRIQGLTLIDVATKQPLYAQQLDTTKSTWDQALASEPEPRRRAIGLALAQLHTLRAKQFTAEKFDPDHADTPQGPQPWKYRLDVSFGVGPGTAATPNASFSLFLTDRLAGNTQLAGTAESGGVVFTLPQDLLDALFTLTYAAQHDPGPPPTPPKP